jgi:cytochrome P450
VAGNPIDLLSPDLHGDAARRTYAWMRREAPVYLDEQHALWGVATYDGVITASRDPVNFSNAGGSRPDTRPLPWMIDMDGAPHRTRR